MQSSKGFSLIELIVVIAVMVILSVGGVTIFGIVSGNAAKQCANELSSLLEKCRIDTMSKSTGRLTDGSYSTYLELDIDDGDIYATLVTPVGSATKRLGSASKISLQATSTVGGSTVTLTDDDSSNIRIGYNRSTGGLESIETDSSGSIFWETIEIAQHGITYEIQFFPATGKHTLTKY